MTGFVAADTTLANGAVKTKADAVRSAVAKGMTSPTQISAFIKTTYGMEISAGTVSAYKSADKTKGKKAPKAPAVAPAAVKPLGNFTGNGFIAQLEAIKKLVNELGPDHVKRVVDLFA